MHEVKHWLQQIQHLLTLTVIFLGTALPALFYGALLGYGVILDNTATTSHSLAIVWSILVVQSIILLLSKSAILGSRYAYFLQSIQSSRAKSLAFDAWFGLLCSPFLIMLGFILASIELAHWSKFSHGFMLFFLQFALCITCLYRPKAAVRFLALSIFSVIFLQSFSLSNALIACSLLFVITCLLLEFVKFPRHSRIHKIPIQYRIWLSIVTSNKAQGANGKASASKINSLIMCAALSAIFLLMGSYSASNLPDYQLVVHFITGQLLVLTCLGLQISVDKTIKAYPLFFAQFMPQGQIVWLQYWVCISMGLLTLFVAGVLFSSWLTFSHILALGFCLLFIKRYSAFLMVAWLLSCALLGFVYFS